MTADARRVIDDARAVFVRLDEDATRHLERSWRGPAGRRALAALRHYISDALGGLPDPSLQAGSVPLTAGLTTGATASTAPAGYGGVPPASPSSAAPFPSRPPIINHRNAFDDYGASTSTPPGAVTPATVPMRPLRDPRGSSAPLPSLPPPVSAPSNEVPASASAQPVPTGQARGVVPYPPLMGAAYPGALAPAAAGNRRPPGFLISIDNGNELIGPLPKAVPPVLGA